MQIIPLFTFVMIYVALLAGASNLEARQCECALISLIRRIHWVPSYHQRGDINLRRRNVGW
jgi:hypothetical protein